MKFPIQSRHEAMLLLLAGICFFSVLASYYMIRPIREQFATAMGGSSALPMLYAIVFVTISLLQPVYGALVSRFPRRIFVPIIYAGFFLCLFALGPFFELDLSLQTKGIAFYVWVSVFNLFVVAVFWSCMADVFKPEQAVRLYGTVMLFGSAGAVVGPKIAQMTVLEVGHRGLYQFSSMFLLSALVCLVCLFNFSKHSAQENVEKPLGGSLWDGAKITFQTPLLLRLAILLLCIDGVSTILYTINSDYAKTIVSELARTEYFASIDYRTNVLQALLQLLVAPILLQTLGAGKSMSMPAMLNCLALIGLAMLGDTMLLTAAVICSRGFGYGLVNPARESLFTLIDRDAKYKAKNFIDTVVWRFGDLIMVCLVAVSIYFGAKLPTLALFAAGFALAGSLLSWHVLKLPAKASAVPQDTDKVKISR